MSISSEITRLQTLRNNIRTKLIALGVISDSSASLNDCYTGINSIAKKTSQTYTPTTSNQTIASGQYLSGAQTISGDANLVAGNIKQGVSIFGVSGSHAGQKTEQSKTVTPTASGFTVSPDSGKVLSSVVINGDVDLVAGNVKKNVNIFGVTGTLEEGITPTGTISITSNGSHDVTNYASASVNVPVPLNPHATNWNFSERSERLMKTYEGTYAFNLSSTQNYMHWLPTDDLCWINGGWNVGTNIFYVYNFKDETLVRNSVSNVTTNGFTFTVNDVNTTNCILIPYFLKAGQTFSITYTRSGSNYGGYIWASTHGEAISSAGNNQIGAATSTWSYTAPTDGWLYWLVGKYDGRASVTLSNCSVTIS